MELSFYKPGPNSNPSINSLSLSSQEVASHSTMVLYMHFDFECKHKILSHKNKHAYMASKCKKTVTHSQVTVLFSNVPICFL